MDDWRSPKAKVKAWFKKIIFRGLTLFGRSQAESAADKETIAGETVTFYGHRIGASPTLGLHHETRRAFPHRDSHHIVQNIFYSERGVAWVNGTLMEAYSLKPIGMKDHFHTPPDTCQTIAQCAVVQCDYAYSYGDWVHCYLGPLLSTDFPDIPVLVPRHLAAKSYVRRDLDGAGLNWQAAEGWTHIEDAIVIRKQNPNFYWSPKNVADFRATFAPNPIPANPASKLYLGRFGLQGETIARAFPSEETAAYIRSVGGTVVNQSDLTTQTAAAYAADAETVIGDHGSGLLNILFWKSKTVIELVVDDWWVNNTLFVAAGMGIENFAVLNVDGRSSQEIGEMIEACLEYFAQQESNHP